MDGKIIAYIFFLAAVVAGTYGIYYTTQVDEAQRKLSTLEAQIETTARSMQQFGKTLEERRQIVALQTELDAAEKAAEATEADLQAAKKEHEKIRQEFEIDIVAVREASTGLSFPSITLVNGTVLKNAKIQRVEESGLAILNDMGVSKVMPAELPQELRDRLRFGPEYALPSLMPAPTPAQPVIAAPQSTFSSTPSSRNPAPDPEAEARQKRILEGRAAVTRFKREIDSLERELTTATYEAANPSTSASRRYYANTRKATLEQQIAAVRRQLDAAEVELARLGVAPSR